ncbi:MAG: hypothetical protein IBX69_11115 [Anaerolineales bacterium]|nr:hypothetical protein [Anaerolineales bacterium]
MQWDEDLSGPFAVLIINKSNGRIICITDLLMFIPVYQYKHDHKLILGTHVDALALAAGCSNKIDHISLVDFILHGVVIYPYTFYKMIRQCQPATVHIYRKEKQKLLSGDNLENYWVPDETDQYENINEAAIALRESLQENMGRITNGFDHVAQFISGGEDTRVLAGLLPSSTKCDAYIFLDEMNREGKIAKALAEKYGMNFFVQTRTPTHYLDILPEACNLIGSGHQYMHAHSLGFHKTCGLDSYPAVLGGYGSDFLLKGLSTRQIRGHNRFPFLPEILLPGETRSRPIKHRYIRQDLLSELFTRRLQHFENVKRFRQQSIHEWFSIWPATMRVAIPNLYCNRRLFRSYEVFLSNEVVKLSSAIPTSWKLNRRLFNKATRPLLKPSKWLFHSDGRLPYFPWWVNIPVQFVFMVSQYIGNRIGLIQGNQGSWADWNRLYRDEAWSLTFHNYRNEIEHIFENYMELDSDYLTSLEKFKVRSQLNLLQVAYFLSKT